IPTGAGCGNPPDGGSITSITAISPAGEANSGLHLTVNCRSRGDGGRFTSGPKNATSSADGDARQTQCHAVSANRAPTKNAVPNTLAGNPSASMVGQIIRNVAAITRRRTAAVLSR